MTPRRDHLVMLVPALSAVALALVHIVADRLRMATVVPRSVWLSAASGASVAFVFLLMLPELAARQDALSQLPALESIDHHVWLVALIGLAGFYVVEHWMLTHGQRRTEATHGAFAAHVGIFAVYNVVIGYLLFDPHPEVVANGWLYALALGLHLLVVDDAMRRHHPERYHRTGRWVLAAAVLVGAVIGAAAELPDAIPAAALALLAGGIILNALKDELPEEREARTWPFLAGAGLFATLMVVATLG